MAYTYNRIVTLDELDFNNHVAYEMHLRYAKEAEIQFREDIGITAQSVKDKGLVLNAIHTECRYKKELFLNDRIEVLLDITKIGTSSFTYDFKILKQKDIASYGNTTTIFVNPAKRQKEAIPTEFRKILERYFK